MKRIRSGRFGTADRRGRSQIGKAALQNRLDAAGAGIIICDGCQHLAIGEIHRHMPAPGKQRENPVKGTGIFTDFFFERSAGTAQDQREPAVGTNAVIVVQISFQFLARFHSAQKEIPENLVNTADFSRFPAPVKHDLLFNVRHGLFKIYQGSGLEQVFRHPVFHRGPCVFKVRIGAQYDCLRMQSLCCHPLQHLQSVHDRHTDIRDDDIRFLFTDQFQPVITVFRDSDNFIIPIQLRQELFDSFPDPDLILNDCNLHMHCCSLHLFCPSAARPEILPGRS